MGPGATNRNMEPTRTSLLDDSHIESMLRAEGSPTA